MSAPARAPSFNRSDLAPGPEPHHRFGHRGDGDLPIAVSERRHARDIATLVEADTRALARALAQKMPRRPSALAEAGVNVQQAKHLAGHTSPLVHQRYVMRTAAMRSIPDAALPRIPWGTPVGSLRPSKRHGP